MTIKVYADNLFNEYSIVQQYNHAEVETTKAKMRTLREVCILWRVQDYRHLNSHVLSDIINEVEELLK